MDDPPVYSVDDLDDDVDLEDDEIDDDDDTSSSNPPPDPQSIVTVASVADHTHVLAIPAVTAPSEKKPVASAGLFQRLWTDEDEIELLKGFLEYTSQRGGAHHSSQHHDTAAFYDQIKSKLQLDFNKNQLVEKLRRLKKKYRTVAGKMSTGKEYVFKSAHDQATFEISRQIWYEPMTRVVEQGYEDHEVNPVSYGNPNFISFHHNDNGVDLNFKGSAKPRKRVKLVKPEEATPHFSQQVPQVATPVGSSVTGMIEETVKSCLTPILKELTRNSTSGSRGIGGTSAMGFGLGNLSPLDFTSGGEMSGAMEEKWRKQQLLELEVYSKRLALVQEQIKSTMEELRAKGS